MVLAAVWAAVAWSAPVAQAAGTVEGTGWEAFVQAYPTYLHPGGNGTIQVDLMNTGAKRSSGPITVTDILPEGVVPVGTGGMVKAGGMTEAKIESAAAEVKEFGGVRWNCEALEVEVVPEVDVAVVTCTSNPKYVNGLPIGEGEKLLGVERIGIAVHVEEGVESGEAPNEVSIAGGGATEVTEVSSPVTLNSSEPGYGFSGFDAWFTNADGTIDTQAGSHPYESTFAVGFNELTDGHTAGGEERDLEVELPPGFFGEPNSAPRCTRQQLGAEECPAETQIGEAVALFAEEGGAARWGEGRSLYTTWCLRRGSSISSRRSSWARRCSSTPGRVATATTTSSPTSTALPRASGWTAASSNCGASRRKQATTTRGTPTTKVSHAATGAHPRLPLGRS